MIFIIFLLISRFCSFDQYFNNDTSVLQTKYHKIVLNINNSRADCIGYLSNIDDPDISVSSIFIYNNTLFIADRADGNIKKIDLITNKLLTSQKLNQFHNPWINDLVVYNGNLVVTSDLDSLYYLNLDLNKIKSIFLPIGKKYIVNLTDSSLTIFNTITLTCYKLSHSLNLLSTDSCLYDVWNKASILNTFNYVNKKEKYIIIPKGKVKLKTDFPENLIKYDALNLTYDEHRLIYFQIRSNNMIIHLYCY